MKISFIILCAVGIFSVLFSFMIASQDDPWKVPENYKKLKNPVKADEASIASGKEFYKTYCISCHGADGKGNGKRAYKLDNSPADFTTGAFQKQTDGSVLYIIYTGHQEMPGFKKKLLPGSEDVSKGAFGTTRGPGDLVNYVRSFYTATQKP